MRIDVRTKTMSTTALTCRTWGHAPTPIPAPARRRAELRERGQYPVRMVCLRGCTRYWENIYDLDSEELVARKSGYIDKESYLIQQKGSGRLPRGAARAAWRRAGGLPKARQDGLMDFPEDV